jgi:hypothetical protein
MSDRNEKQRAQRDEFSSAGSFITMKELLDELVLFAPTEHVDEVATTFGTKDAVITDLAVLTREGQPVYEDVMILQGAIIGTLKRNITESKDIIKDDSTGLLFEVTTRSSRAYLGVVGIGDAKKGQNAPYELHRPTEEQKQVARDFLAAGPFVREPSVTKVLFDAPAPIAQAAQPTPVAQAAQPEDPFAVSQPEDPFAVKQ